MLGLRFLPYLLADGAPSALLRLGFLAVCIRLVNCGVLPTARFGDGLLPMRENKTPAVIVGMRSGNCKV